MKKSLFAVIVGAALAMGASAVAVAKEQGQRVVAGAKKFAFECGEMLSWKLFDQGVKLGLIKCVVNQIGDENPDGMRLGASASSKVGFFGATPVTQRAAAAQATSLLSTASSTAIDTATKAAIIEIMNTLTALGAWKGSA